MDSIECQDHHDDEVGNQDGKIECVPAVEPTEGVVAIVRVQVMAKPPGGQKQGRLSVQVVEKGEQNRTPQRCLRSRRFYAKPLIKQMWHSCLYFAYAKYIHELWTFSSSIAAKHSYGMGGRR